MDAATSSGVDWSSASDQADAETARLSRYESAALSQEAANNRTMLNAANTAAEGDYFGPAWSGGEAFASNTTKRRQEIAAQDASSRVEQGIGSEDDIKLLKTVGWFPSSQRIDSSIPIAGPSGLTKVDGSPATYSFNERTKQAYWDLGEEGKVAAIPLAFRQPSLQEAALADPSNSFANGPRLGNVLGDVALLNVGGLAGMATGGWAFGAMRSAGLLTAGATAGVVGDLTVQATDNAVWLATGGQYGRPGINGTELALSAGLGALPGLPGAVRGWADDLRSLGVPDWNIRGASIQPGVLHSNPVPLEFERITQQGHSGPVVFRAPPGATAEEIAQVRAYVDASNEALQSGRLSPTGRVSTAGDLRTDASLAAAQERARAAAVGQQYQGHAGHVPDTTWTGSPQPYRWLDLSPRVNSSLGGQAAAYPVGYQPTGFIFRFP